METTGAFRLAAVSLILMFGSAPVAVGQRAIAAVPNVAVGAQYDSTHVYVTAEDFDRFVASVVATFGGTTSKRAVTTVTPTPSDTISQIISTPVGMFSVFGYETPIPYPFGTDIGLRFVSVARISSTRNAIINKFGTLQAPATKSLL